MQRLIACATGTSKNSVNQDYCVSIENLEVGLAGVILADGIGAHFKSELASEFCAKELKKILEEITHINQLSFENHFKDVKAAFIDYSKKTDQFDFNAIDKTQSLGTTLICVIDCGENYHIAYSGNGSVWQIDGRFNKFGKSYYLPWNSINLLNPHSIEQDGKAALYRYLSVSDTQPRPTVLTLSKNKFIPGEILVATTDGIYSNDAVPVGKDDQGRLWIKGEESLPFLYDYLSDFLETNPGMSNSNDLETKLNDYLEFLKTSSLMHDDTSIGVIISQQTISYHQKEFETKNEKDSD